MFRISAPLPRSITKTKYSSVQVSHCRLKALWQRARRAMTAHAVNADDKCNIYFDISLSPSLVSLWLMSFPSCSVTLGKGNRINFLGGLLGGKPPNKRAKRGASSRLGVLFLKNHLTQCRSGNSTTDVVRVSFLADKEACATWICGCKHRCAPAAVEESRNCPNPFAADVISTRFRNMRKVASPDATSGTQ